MSKKYIVGIDPGFTGAIAILQADLDKKGPDAYTLAGLYDMPTVEMHDRVEIDARQITFILKSLDVVPNTAVVEKAQASPQMGVTSAFRYGEGYGLVCGVLHSLNIRVKPVHAATWKAHFNLNQNKDRSLRLARQLFSNRMHWFAHKKDHGRAEAALLAFYGLQKFRGHLKRAVTIDELI